MVISFPVADNFTNHYSSSQDSVYVLASAIKEMMQNETITEPPKNCGDSGVNWESGKHT